MYLQQKNIRERTLHIRVGVPLINSLYTGCPFVSVPTLFLSYFKRLKKLNLKKMASDFFGITTERKRKYSNFFFRIFLSNSLDSHSRVRKMNTLYTDVNNNKYFIAKMGLSMTNNVTTLTDLFAFHSRFLLILKVKSIDISCTYFY